MTITTTINGNDLGHYVRRMSSYISADEFATIRKAYEAAPSTTIAILDDICTFKITINDALPFLARIAAR